MSLLCFLAKHSSHCQQSAYLTRLDLTSQMSANYLFTCQSQEWAFLCPRRQSEQTNNKLMQKAAVQCSGLLIVVHVITCDLMDRDTFFSFLLLAFHKHRRARAHQGLSCAGPPSIRLSIECNINSPKDKMVSALATCGQKEAEQQKRPSSKTTGDMERRPGRRRGTKETVTSSKE